MVTLALTERLSVTINVETQTFTFGLRWRQEKFSISFDRVEKIFRLWDDFAANDRDKQARLTGAMVSGLLAGWCGINNIYPASLEAAMEFMTGWAKGLATD